MFLSQSDARKDNTMRPCIVTSVDIGTSCGLELRGSVPGMASNQPLGKLTTNPASSAEVHNDGAIPPLLHTQGQLNCAPSSNIDVGSLHK
jgi:hypothetical protein